MIRKCFGSYIFFRIDDRNKVLSSHLRAMSKTARDRVLPAPKTSAIHVRMASNSAIETVKICRAKGWLLQDK